MSHREAEILFLCVEYLHRLPQELHLSGEMLVDLAVFHRIKQDIADEAARAARAK